MKKKNNKFIYYYYKSLGQFTIFHDRANLIFHTIYQYFQFHN